MNTSFVQPARDLDAFNCPHCNVHAAQEWFPLTRPMFNNYDKINDYYICQCGHCKKITFWENKDMVYPSTGNAPMSNPDMPDEIKEDYNEARDIVLRSPRSACVLLRLCIEKICDEKKTKGNDLNEKIKKLAEQGLDDSIIKALDTVRVIGGQAVHPLEMDLKDDVNTATMLFRIVNYISDWAYTRKKTIDNIFESLPDGKKKAIKSRNS